MPSPPNYGYLILETSREQFNGPKPVVHRLITVRGQEPRHLIFTAEPTQVSNVEKNGLAAMTAHAVAVADTARAAPAPIAGSPIDFAVDRQCWVLISLDPDTNWQFTVGEVPCTLKHPDVIGENIYLRHVYAEDDEAYEGKIERQDCRTIFFAVSSRGSNQASCRINLNIEFKQGDKRLQLIVDPDVPNSGDGDIP